ncbi:MAG: cytochrome c [Gemmatimonadota bacterium]|nr:cytochrome c [Gemmatimonadota bacterium]
MNVPIHFRRLRRRSPSILRLAAALLLAACGAEPAADAAPADSAAEVTSASDAGALSQVELDQGLGPIRDLTLDDVDAALAATGEGAFVTKCSACHKIEDRYVGPRLGTVLARRRPEYVMNMILNANEMVQRHPQVRELLAQFYTPMPVQVTDPAEARAILEYLRTVQMDTLASPTPASNGAGGL